MIELFEGVPGSGKSFYAIGERFLPWVQADRRIYVYVDGIYLDRLAYLLGRDQGELERQITIWKTADQVKAELTLVEPNASVLIDESQELFRALHRVDPVLLRWLETHRHIGVHVVLMCQDYRNLAQTVTRLVECTTRFRKLWFLGFANRFQARVRGNPEDLETIRSFTGVYRSTTYAFYDSYASKTVQEQRVANHVWFQPKVLVGVVAGLFVCLVLWLRPWTSLESTARAQTPASVPTAPAKKLLGGPGFAPSKTPEGLVAPPSPAPVIRIQGVLIVEEGPEGERMPRYLLEDGSALTAAQIAGRYGIQVQEVREGAFTRLIGEGLVYESSGH